MKRDPPPADELSVQYPMSSACWLPPVNNSDPATRPNISQFNEFTSIKKIIRRKKREYKRARRSDRWRQLQRRSEDMIAASREKFFNGVKNDMQVSGNSRDYFNAVRKLAATDGEKPRPWTINSMFPGESDAAVADKVATYFNQISQEYAPLEIKDCMPGGIDNCPALHEIASRLRRFKKPKSRVRGDIFRQLVAPLADVLAIPLHIIFQKAYQEGIWPEVWRTETVTVIPKTSRPTGLNQLRNLSCTPLFSKVLESFVLERLKTEVSLSSTQFGGIKGSGVDHFLIETWDEILRGLEDSRAGVTLASIDFEKAFNRMCHYQCLSAAEEMGAGRTTLAMLRAFLTGRQMSVKINDSLSPPRNVPGGSPQGSILANFLFCLTTDQLNKCVPNNQTLELSQNGIDISNDSSIEVPFSPIARPNDEYNVDLNTSGEDEEIRASDFIYLNPNNRLEDTVMSTRATQDEIERVFGIPDRWERRQLRLKIYIDDMNSIEKVSLSNAVSEITTSKRRLLVHSPQTQGFFENISGVASEIGMRVNQKKMQILCISASNDIVQSYIRPTTGNTTTETTSTDELKILGFWFGRKPNVALHVDKLCEGFRKHLWSLRHLRRYGMKSDDLANIYQTTLRPIIEFANVVYGPLLTTEQSGQIEGLQLRVLKIVYGTTVSYEAAMEFSRMDRLSDRRATRITKFAQKSYNNNVWKQRWFPPAPTSDYNIRNPKKLLEEKSTTNRLYNSPLFTMRRILNSNLK